MCWLEESRMFFVLVLNGGRTVENRSFVTMTELARHARSEFKRERADAYIVSVGAMDQAVMPYAWVTRDEGRWIGGDGDSIRLGLDQNEIAEHDALEMIGLDEAVHRGVASIFDDGNLRTVVFGDEGGKSLLPKESVDHSGDEAKALKMARSILKKAGL